MRNFMICTLHQILFKLRRDGLGMWHIWEDRRGAYRIWWKNPRGKKYLENLGVDGGIILKWGFKKRIGGGMDWVYLTQNRDRWWILLNAAMNLCVP
jgi:hypothetical protein